ncbi:XdhC family protein [Dehalobacter sp. DCM]|uniref:XdhC family protein n=1 Tax=Dehalobacter sp. DCM TaxID=2907827 RepID=UPI003081F6D7|nr:XdhC family protein [Dehalobacter sp. DCM]
MENSILSVLRQNNSEKFVLATIIQTYGSTPRMPGTKMLVGEDGLLAGTIGGGMAEKTVCQRALQLLQMNESTEITAEIQYGLPTCGGSVDILMELHPDKNFWHFVNDIQSNGKEAVILTALFPPYQKSIHGIDATVVHGVAQPNLKLSDQDRQRIFQDKRTVIIGKEKEIWLAEPLARIEKLLILGAGHVGKWVAYGAKPLDFQVTVIDEREDFAQLEQLPGADAVICRDFISGIQSFQPDTDTYVVIASWSHQTDADCLEEVLKYEVPYVGMLGSTKKISGIVSNLQNKGITTEKLEQLRAPIGLDIRAKTPQEIAIGVLAEIISIRRRE